MKSRLYISIHIITYKIQKGNHCTPTITIQWLERSEEQSWFSLKNSNTWTNLKLWHNVCYSATAVKDGEEGEAVSLPNLAVFMAVSWGDLNSTWEWEKQYQVTLNSTTNKPKNLAHKKGTLTHTHSSFSCASQANVHRTFMKHQNAHKQCHS